MALSAGIAESSLYLHSGITLAGAICLFDAANNQSYPGTGITWFNLIQGTTFVGNAIKAGSQVAQGWPKWDSRGWFSFNGGNVGNNFGRFDFTFPQLNDVSYFAWFRTRWEPWLTNDMENTAQHIMRSQNSIDSASSYQFFLQPSFTWGLDSISVSISNNYFPGPTINGYMADGRWHQIFGTRNHSTNVVTAYLDGVALGTDSSVGQQPKAGTMRIGARNDAYSAHYYGSIAMCGMYNRTLTAQEVYLNYLAMEKRLNRPDYRIGYYPYGDPTRYYER